MDTNNHNDKSANLLINDFDIATIEALHDLLLDKGYSIDFKILKNARALTARMDEALNQI